ncbi:DUF1302 domain-containing protein [Pseudomonas sp. HR96]|uniref:DUF1302 domain-containing protein n=1 Tax=Pseudomonas sp. HR96 TaxID=1027966 RepID=UPI002A75EDC6|nr:DUF1302 domain-containing protein [Pseudomonas sp. HR96]WPP02071.1 DUF1302 domain-containing protein [Pseudomonas sp. HR96]
MNNTKGTRTMYPHALAMAVAAASAMPAHAADFDIGEITGRFDSTLSIGTSIGTSNADKKFIGVANGGTASSRTSDDGRLNFHKGQAFSEIFKGVHDLELKYQDTGVFVRAKYWYDFALENGHQHLYDVDDSGRDTAARSSGAEILDAFIYHNYTIADLPGSVRAGKQVVSWGESTFIGNSINSINPLDVSALRRPGSEVKEGLIPVNMLYFNQGVSSNLSLEGFYQLSWEKTELDNCGTYFGSDVAAKGCTEGMTINGSDFDRSASSYGYVPRLSDNDARNSGQFGVALRWTVPQLNDTEFGLYALNYHARNPEFNWVVGKGALADPVGGLRGAGGVSSARYYLTYPEDIRLYGLSFATNVGATALSGELSYRPNMPMSLNASDVSNAAVLGSAATSPLVNAGLPVFSTGWASSSYGSTIQGYKRMPYTQAQTTAVRTFDHVLGGDRLNLVAEAGVGYISGLGATDGSDLRFGRSSVYGNGSLADAGTALLLGGLSGNAICKALNSANPGECNSKGYYTPISWGYRLRAVEEYSDVFAGVNLKPNLTFSHDVRGNGPSFTEGSKAVSLGVDADYLSKYTASLSYTNFFGGDYNTTTDRDFVALSVGMSF